jgi:type IX secretion system PorP/SprF family membrane protein
LNKHFYILFYCLAIAFVSKGQGVVLSQPFVSSQFLNSASVGNGLYGSRLQSNLKSQMIDGQNLYKTIVVGFDTRFKAADNTTKNYLGFGTQLISDQVMNGVMQTNLLTMNLAYHIYLDDYLYKNIALGLGSGFTQTTLDRTKLRFADQYDYRAILTNSISMENILPYPTSFSANASALYTKHDQKSFFQTGASAFFLDKPNMTYSLVNTAPENKYRLFVSTELPVMGDYFIALHGNYLYQKSSNQLNVGAFVGVPAGYDEDDVKRIYFGCFYRANEAIVPSVSIISNKYIFGLSYDIYNNNKTSSTIKVSSFELSLSASMGRKKTNLFRTLFD